MKTVRIFLIVLVLSALCVSSWAVFLRHSEVRDSKKTEARLNAYYMDESHYPSIQKTSGQAGEDRQILGMIVSHHLFVENYIAETLAAAKNQKPSVVVIIGPNHFQSGQWPILSTNLSYETPFGSLSTDTKSLRGLVKNNVLRIENRPFEREHSISALVAQVKFLWPDTKLLPIIIKKGTNDSQLDLLSRELHEALPKDALIIGSVDFSHHLNRTMAKFHDSASVDSVTSFDFARLKNTEVDSPESLRVLLSYLQSRQAQQSSLKNTNQAEVSGNLASEDVTSYVFAKFYEGKPEKQGNVTLKVLPPINQLEAENYAASGVDIFENLKGVEGNFLKGGDLKVGVLVDAEGACVPSESGAISERLADNFREYKIRYIYLPHSSCKPNENIPGSLGGFIDIDSGDLRPSPYVVAKVNNKQVVLAHLPETEFEQARNSVVQELKSINSNVVIMQYSVEQQDVSFIKDVKPVARFVVGPSKYLGKDVFHLESFTGGVSEMYGLVLGEILEKYTFKYSLDEKKLPKLLLE